MDDMIWFFNPELKKRIRLDLPSDSKPYVFKRFVQRIFESYPKLEYFNISDAAKKCGVDERTARKYLSYLSNIKVDGKPIIYQAYKSPGIVFYRGCTPLEEVRALAGSVGSWLAKEAFERRFMFTETVGNVLSREPFLEVRRDKPVMRWVLRRIYERMYLSF